MENSAVFTRAIRIIYGYDGGYSGTEQTYEEIVVKTKLEVLRAIRAWQKRSDNLSVVNPYALLREFAQNQGVQAFAMFEYNEMFDSHEYIVLDAVKI